MKQYVIDELRPHDHIALQTHLNNHCHAAGVTGIYLIFLEDQILNPCQRAHTDCRPFYMALELTPERLACELLVRSRQRLRCDCIAYADNTQLLWLVQRIDAILTQLDLIC